eukprot:3889550-Pyramimonas_sp.AAC.1
MTNMIYQGTVFGPPLWNIFFHDAAAAVRQGGFQELVFADDLNAVKAYPGATSNACILNNLSECQLLLHSWGQANAVLFDAGKESQHVLSHRHPH